MAATPPTRAPPHHSSFLDNSESDATVSRALHAVHLAQVKVEHSQSQTHPAGQPSMQHPGPGGTFNQSRLKRQKLAPEPASAGGRSSGKGLRHFSMQVCRKVESKGRTTYSEVADELVTELSRGADAGMDDETQYDEKNIRRRVYDAINVLMAMDIIQKEKKNIIWRGLPTARGSGVEELRLDKLRLSGEVDKKQAYLQELVEQQRALKALLERNPDISSAGETTLELPFILVQAASEATIEVHISEDMQDVQFDFYDAPFQIHDDSFVLRHMALHQAVTQQSALQAGPPSPSVCRPPSPPAPPAAPAATPQSGRPPRAARPAPQTASQSAASKSAAQAGPQPFAVKAEPLLDACQGPPTRASTQAGRLSASQGALQRPVLEPSMPNLRPPRQRAEGAASGRLPLR